MGRPGIAAALLLSACRTDQSALHPAGRDAADLAALFWAMAIAGAAIWLVVMGIAVYAVLGRHRPRSERFGDRFIFIGGIAFPTIVLALLLLTGLRLLPDWRPADRPDLRVHVVAEQFWWRIGYEAEDGSTIESANELHLPSDAVVEFVLTSTDVIHSFWIPVLGGKMDAIPGRTNLLRLRPTTPGLYRGVCAEYCGLSHALMAFPVVIHDPGEFRTWLATEAGPARGGDASAFLAAGCGACHRVRGIAEAGSVGPDLTRLARRQTIAAGTLPLEPWALSAWIASADHVKPGAGMPGFASLGEAELAQIVAFLMELR